MNVMKRNSWSNRTLLIALAVLLVLGLFVGYTFASQNAAGEQVTLTSPTGAVELEVGTSATAVVAGRNQFSSNSDVATVTPVAGAFGATAIRTDASATNLGPVTISVGSRTGALQTFDYHVVNSNNINRYTLPQNASQDIARNATNVAINVQALNRNGANAANQITWTSMNTSVVTVNANGTINATAPAGNNVNNDSTILVGSFTDVWGVDHTIALLVNVGGRVAVIVIPEFGADDGNGNYFVNIDRGNGPNYGGDVYIRTDGDGTPLAPPTYWEVERDGSGNIISGPTQVWPNPDYPDNDDDGRGPWLDHNPTRPPGPCGEYPCECPDYDYSLGNGQNLAIEIPVGEYRVVRTNFASNSHSIIVGSAFVSVEQIAPNAWRLTGNAIGSAAVQVAGPGGSGNIAVTVVPAGDPGPCGNIPCDCPDYDYSIGNSENLEITVPVGEYRVVRTTFDSSAHNVITGGAFVSVEQIAPNAWRITGNALGTAAVQVSGPGGSANIAVHVVQGSGGAPGPCGEYPCDCPSEPTLEVGPSTPWTAPAAGGSDTRNITSNSSWTVSSNQPWLTVAPTSGTGDGSFTMNAAANPTTQERTAIVTVTSGDITRTIVITQPAGPATLTLEPTAAWAAPVAGGTRAQTVTSNVTWTASSNAAWLTITNTTAGGFTMNAAANTATTSRSATVTVTGGGISRQVSVTQAGAAANLTLSPTTAWAAPVAGGTRTQTVTSNISWTVSSNAAWLTITNTTASGFTMNAAANTATTSRSATVTVTGGGLTRTISVTQTGAAANLTLSPTTTWAAPAAGGTRAQTVASNISWTVSSSAAWLTVSPASGSNNGSFTMTAAANTGAARSATVTLTGGGITRTVTVTQTAATAFAPDVGGTFTCSRNVTWRVLHQDANGNRLIMTEHVHGDRWVFGSYWRPNTPFNSGGTYTRLSQSDLRSSLNTWGVNNLAPELAARSRNPSNVDSDVRVGPSGDFRNWDAERNENGLAGFTTPGLPTPSSANQSLFVLSISEANQYFANNDARRAWSIGHSGSQQTDWWLRSPGDGGRGANMGSAVRGRTGVIDPRGQGSNQVGFRPALWISPN